MEGKPNVNNRRMLRLIVVLMILSSAQVLAQTRIGRETRMQDNTLSLNKDWHFHQIGKEDWYPATVPGCVHTDLLANKLIEDPFYRDNEQKQQWIGKTDWEYQTTFNVTPELLKHDHLELVFEGLDTYANVFLNDAS